MLTLVPTPIGNLQDITLRGLESLKKADLIYCEDKRQSKKLLSHYGIDTPLESYHEHNAEKVRPQILDQLRAGKSIAVISDAGMPAISDPGYRLVTACQKEELKYTVLPGPSAVLTALVASGLAPDRFIFGGFLPSKKGERTRVLEEFFRLPATRIFFESPHRLVECLKDIHKVMGDRQLAVCRELTKLYEEVKKGPVSEVLAWYEEHPPKGEIVLVIEGVVPEESFDLESELREALKTRKTKEAAAYVAEKTGHGKKELYSLALALKEKK